MTLATPCTDRIAAANAGTRRPATSRLATALSWLAARLEHGAQERARRKAMRWTDSELRRLPREARLDLGVPDERVSPLMVGLVGPPDYWRGHVARGDRR